MSQTIDGVNEKVIREFMAEAGEIIENINSDLMAISSSDDIDDIDPDLINSVFRGAHTLKGLAGMFGFQDISHLAHDLEDILDSIRLGKIPLTEDVLDVLFEGMEFLTSLIKDVENTPIGEYVSREEEVGAFIDSLKKKLNQEPEEQEEEAPGERVFYIDKRILSVLTEYEEHRLEENKKKKKNIFLLHAAFHLEVFDDELTKLTNDFKPLGEVVSILPSSGEAAEGTIEFDILTGTNKSVKEIAAVMTSRMTIVDLYKKPKDWNGGIIGGIEEAAPEPPPEASIKVGDEPADEAADKALVEEVVPLKEERHAEEKRAEKKSEKTATKKVEEAASKIVKDSIKSITQTVRVDVSRLDSLMNVVGELVLSKAIIGEISDKLKAMEGFTGIAVDLYKANRVLSRKLDDLQKRVMDIRMIPLSQVFEKMTRIVRKFTRQSGKLIDLKIFGADTELDKLIVEDLGDPLMHVVRNAMDHGIEHPEEREKLTKTKEGTITLRASQKGNYVVIEVEDDGRGIDKKRVRLKAIEKGLVLETDELKEQDIYNLLLLPGFSTAEEVTETSGRGVGMDVVKSNISKLSGMIDITSTEGEGSKIALTLPITLAIIQALIIQLSDNLYAVPLNSVSEILKISPDKIKTIEKKEVMQLRDETLPLLRLKNVFLLPDAQKEQEKLFVVVVGFGLNKIGIVVDALKGQQDIVIKSIGDTFKNIKGIAGATDLGNQKTILVLDVGALIEEALH